MKRRRLLMLVGCGALTLIVSTGAIRQAASEDQDLDVLEVIPETYKLLIDNPFVRVIEARIPAGTVEKPHRQVRNIGNTQSHTIRIGLKP